MCRANVRQFVPSIVFALVTTALAACHSQPTSPSDPGSTAPTSTTLFSDDFDRGGGLSGWIVGGRRLEGTNTADVVQRNGSNQGHLFKFSFTEIELTPGTAPFPFSPNLTFDFDLEVRTSSTGGVPSNYYGMAGARFEFLDAAGTRLGFVAYLSATTSFPYTFYAGDPTVSLTTVTEGSQTRISVSGQTLLSRLMIDATQVASVNLEFFAYSSTRPIPYVEAEVWIDNVRVWLPAAS